MNSVNTDRQGIQLSPCSTWQMCWGPRSFTARRFVKQQGRYSLFCRLGFQQLLNKSIRGPSLLFLGPALASATGPFRLNSCCKAGNSHSCRYSLFCRLGFQQLLNIRSVSSLLFLDRPLLQAVLIGIVRHQLLQSFLNVFFDLGALCGS